jgi:hypothetical protein
MKYERIVPHKPPLLKWGMVRQAHHDVCHPELAEGWYHGGDFLFIIPVSKCLKVVIVRLDRTIQKHTTNLDSPIKSGNDNI